MDLRGNSIPEKIAEASSKIESKIGGNLLQDEEIKRRGFGGRERSGDSDEQYEPNARYNNYIRHMSGGTVNVNAHHYYNRNSGRRDGRSVEAANLKEEASVVQKKNNKLIPNIPNLPAPPIAQEYYTPVKPAQNNQEDYLDSRE